MKYKTKDQKETEEALIGLKEDKEGTTKELDAVLESAWLRFTLYNFFRDKQSTLVETSI